MIAKFAGSKCLTCGLAIHAGHDEILPIPGLKFAWRHDDCTMAHQRAEVRRFMDAGRSIAGICDLYYVEIAAQRVPWEIAFAAMDYAAECAEMLERSSNATSAVELLRPV